MVRIFPNYDPLAPDPQAWDQKFSNVFQTTVKVEAAAGVTTNESSPGFMNLYPPYLLACKAPTHKRLFAIFHGESPLNSPFIILLLEISLVIVITRIIRVLLKPLKQPRIVSEIIGGIFIGPSILGRNKTFAANLYPETSQFILRNLGLMGFMYFVFLSAVKMDFSLVSKTKKKQFAIAIVGVLVPWVLVTIVGLIYRKHMDKQLSKFSSIGAVSTIWALPLFPCIYPILQELNLLSSEIGRLSLSIAVISDAVGIFAMIGFEAVLQAENNPMAVLWYFISLVVILAFVIFGVRKVMHKIIECTPEGRPVDQAFVVMILLAVLFMGFLTDMFGMAVANGSFWLGLAIPDGPPLGTTLVERSETILMDILMPAAFTVVGLTTDVFSMSSLGWEGLGPLVTMGVVGYVTKLVSTFTTSVFLDVPYRDSAVISLAMCLRGQVELVLFLHWIDKKIVGIPGFTMHVLLITMVTALATPLISLLYDPTKPYMIHKKRTIQHTPTSDAELRIALAIYDEDSTSALINLIEVCNPSTSTPFSIFALRLVDLVGRASPVFIDHQKQEDEAEADPKYAVSHTIHNTLKLYQESKGDYIKLFNFTAVAPNMTMYQDICELALSKKSTLIILPFHVEGLDSLGGNLTEMVRLGVRSVNSSVLVHSPCSVAVLVDKGHLRQPLLAFRHTELNFAVLFLGGPDSREALCLADRMIGNPNVALTVIRFLSFNFEGDNELEKKMDDGVVTWFWVKNERNDRVCYREVVVKNGAETVAAIQTVNDNTYDLWIVGRKEGINPVLLEGLSNWSENHELGVIGDYCSSHDFGGTASVLVVQQQILRGAGGNLTGIKSLVGGLNIC